MMASKGWANHILETLQTTSVELVSAIVLVLIVAATATAQGPTYTVIFNFTGGTDGGNPMAALALDRAGRLYGTTNQGGINGYGTIIRLRQVGSGWVITPTYSFMGGKDGGNPVDAVTVGADDSPYGPIPTPNGGNYGVVFNVKPGVRFSPSIFGGWKEYILHSFDGLPSDGIDPAGPVVFDQAGNLYGTTASDGVCGHGTVYELIRSGNTWILKLLHTFCSSGDGQLPQSGVIFDPKGNLYGISYEGGSDGSGTVFQLVPAGSGWTENILYSFSGGSDGGLPSGGLVFDQSGNLYGTTSLGGANNGGTVFMLAPSNGSWTLSTLYSFTATNHDGRSGNLVLDSAGNLYGTRKYEGMYGEGAAFKLAHSNGGWNYSSLHDFTGGADGGYPLDGLVFDTNGNLYGTAAVGGGNSYGVVYEITP
jgi:uncharacterized repeat protein (TIGR03803 family)